VAPKKQVNKQKRHNIRDDFSLIADGQLERAVSTFADQLRFQETPDPGTLLGLASAFYFSGDKEHAIDILHLALAQINENRFELLQIGLFYAILGREQAADIALTRARTMFLDDPDLLVTICGGFSAIGNLRETVNTAEMAVKADSSSVDAHRALGLARFALEDYPAAIDSFKTVTDLEPQDYLAYVYIGKCLAYMEEWEESLSAFQKAWFIDKKHPAVNIGRAVALFQLGRVRESAKAANLALKHISESPEDAYDLGILYLDELNKPEKAIPALVIAVLDDPESDDCMYGLIEAVTRSKVSDSSRHVLNVLNEADPELGYNFLRALHQADSREDRPDSRQNPFAGTTPATKDGPVYQLRIDLEGASPPIWRRVLVPGYFTLADIHSIIQAVMDWEDLHLHEFNVNGVRIGQIMNADDTWNNADYVNEFDVTMAEVAVASNGKFQYIYDFGDNWVHKIAIEKTLPYDKSVPYPICIGGKQAAPIEDSGGIRGYYLRLKAFADPDSAMHEETVEWLGEDFKPKAFDIDAINRKLEGIGNTDI